MQLTYKTIFLLLLLLFAGGAAKAQPDTASFFDPSVKCHTFDRTSKQKPQAEFQSMQWMQTFAISPSGIFRIHYDTIGYNAVSPTDKSGNGIPDYVDSALAIFDYVHNIEVKQMGYNRPPATPWEAGNAYYDVYIKDLQMYGVTRTWWDFPGNQQGSTKQFTYIEVDNNYSETDTYLDESGKQRRLFNTYGIDGLKVTAAHEYFHAVQFAYEHYLGNNDAIFEMASVCMEILIYPELYDYTFYVNHMLSAVQNQHFGNGAATNGYPFGIWFYMLTLKYGNNIMQEYFELCDTKLPMYPAFDTLLRRHGSSLAAEWQEFNKWLYYTGTNAIENKYFPKAARFRTPTPSQLLLNPGSFVCELYPFDVYFVRYLNRHDNNSVLADTADILPTNIDTAALYYGEKHSYWQPAPFTTNAATQPLAGGAEVFNSYWLGLADTSAAMKCLLSLRPGGQSYAVTTVYPMPFNKQTNQWLYFPIADDIIIGDKARLTIYDMDQMEVYSGEIAATVDSHRHRVLQYNPWELTAGVYTFTISREETDLVGKFVIK